MVRLEIWQYILHFYRGYHAKNSDKIPARNIQLSSSKANAAPRAQLVEQPLICLYRPKSIITEKLFIFCISILFNVVIIEYFPYAQRVVLNINNLDFIKLVEKSPFINLLKTLDTVSNSAHIEETGSGHEKQVLLKFSRNIYKYMYILF